MTTQTETPQGPDWTSLRPEHFDRNLLPRHLRSAPEGLFPVTDALPETAPKARKPADVMEGQGDLFDL